MDAMKVVIVLAVTGVGATSHEQEVSVKVGEAVTLIHHCDLSEGGYIDMGREEGGVHCTYQWTTDSSPPVHEKCQAPDNILVEEETLKTGTGILTLKFAVCLYGQ